MRSTAIAIALLIATITDRVASQQAALNALRGVVSSNLGGNRIGGLVFGPASCTTCNHESPASVPPTPCENCGSSETIAYQPPEQTYQPPPVVWQPPMQNYVPAPIDYSPPAQTITPNAIHLQIPSQTFQPPTFTWQPPAIVWQPPPQTFQPPVQTYHPPPMSFQPSPQTYQPPVQSIPLPAQHYQPPAQTMRPPPQSIPIPPQTIIFPPQIITVPELTPPTAMCQKCPCYWCRARFGSWERPPAREVADAAEQISWPEIAIEGDNATNSTKKPFFVDISSNGTAAAKQQEVNSSKSACSVYIKHFSMEGPLKADKLVDFVNKTFYGSDHANDTSLLTKYAKGIEPSTFHCCHSKFGRDYFPASNSDDKAYVKPLLPNGETCMKLIGKLYKDLTFAAETLKQQNTTQTPERRH